MKKQTGGRVRRKKVKRGRVTTVENLKMIEKNELLTWEKRSILFDLLY